MPDHTARIGPGVGPGIGRMGARALVRWTPARLSAWPSADWPIWPCADVTRQYPLPGAGVGSCGAIHVALWW
jgi:hypothetical protein